jgi:tetratricopeptide (TPR) repeat protein
LPSPGALLAAAARLEKLASKRAQASDVLRAAASRLQLGHIENAVSLLEAEVRLRPSAEAWNDLSVAYLNLRLTQPDVESAVQSLDAATRAATLRPGYAPAHLNIALAASRLHLGALAEAEKTRQPPPQCGRRADRGTSASDSPLEAVMAEIQGASLLDYGFLAQHLQAEVIERVLLRRWASDVENRRSEAAKNAAKRARSATFMTWSIA